MRIDPSARINALEAGASAKSGSKASGAAGGGLASDQAALSPDQARVGALVAQTISLPEIRSEKVAQIASAIREGGIRSRRSRPRMRCSPNCKDGPVWRLASSGEASWLIYMLADWDRQRRSRINFPWLPGQCRRWGKASSHEVFAPGAPPDGGRWPGSGRFRDPAS